VIWRASINLSHVFRRLTRKSLPIVVLALALSGLSVGCGSETVTTESRPERAIEIGARIGPKGVEVSPKEFGAGLTNFTIANLTDYPASFSIEGPTPVRGNEIQPGSSENLEGDLLPGAYRAIAMTISGPVEFAFTVGPPRVDSNQELLLP